MEDSLKQLMHDLGNAINDSLSESDRIAEAIGQIRRSGYDVFLVLEATIGFNRRDENGESEGDAELTGADLTEEVTPTQPNRISTGKIKFTAQDERFLKALKIAVEE